MAEMDPDFDRRAAVQLVAEKMDQIRAQLQDLDSAVAVARAAGATWGQIGLAAGMSRQSAHQRWGHLVGPNCPRQGCPCAEHVQAATACLCGHGPGRGRRLSEPAGVDGP